MQPPVPKPDSLDARQQRHEQRDVLCRFAFPAPFTRHGPVLMVLGTLLAGVVAWLGAKRGWAILIGAGDVKNTDAATAVLAVGAFLIAFQQWRDARREATLEKYYERLDVANRRREAMKDVSDFGMYVFTELDNLEYVIEKYKLGYANSSIAIRGLQTFRSRCADINTFGESALTWVRRAGYLPTTVAVVEAVVSATKPLGNVSPPSGPSAAPPKP